MVERKLNKVGQNVEVKLVPNRVHYTSISLNELSKNSLRLDASAYNINAINAIERIKSLPGGFYTLGSDVSPIREAKILGRFKRIYVDYENIPFYQPATITSIYPRPSRYISEATAVDIDSLRVKKDTLLLTVSGVIGRLRIVGDTLHNCVFSHDLMRISASSFEEVAVLYTYFSTKTGQCILKSNDYGAVIKHIEPKHLLSNVFPVVSGQDKSIIADLISDSLKALDKSNKLIDSANSLFISQLNLDDLIFASKKQSDNSQLEYSSINLSKLNYRLDGSYHSKIKQDLLDAISKVNSISYKLLSDDSLSESIYIGGRFTRVFVDADNGVPYFSGRNIDELDPAKNEKRYLSIDQHNDRIKNELELREGQILVTCSGTVGKTTIVPKHWSGWVGTHDLIRINPSSNEVSGYIYTVLNSFYGQVLMKSLVYGSVVDHIEAQHLRNLPIPILEKDIMNKINCYVSEAFQLRYLAYQKEQAAIDLMKKIINE